MATEPSKKRSSLFSNLNRRITNVKESVKNWAREREEERVNNDPKTKDLSWEEKDAIIKERLKRLKQRVIVVGVVGLCILSALIAGLVAAYAFFAAPIIIFTAVMLGLLAPPILAALFYGLYKVTVKLAELVKKQPTVFLGLIGLISFFLVSFLASPVLGPLWAFILGSSILVGMLMMGFGIERWQGKKVFTTAKMATAAISLGIITAVGLAFFGAPLAALIGVSLPVLGLIGFGIVAVGLPLLVLLGLGLRKNPKIYIPVLLGSLLLVGSFLLPLFFPAFFSTVLLGAIPLAIVLPAIMLFAGFVAWAYAIWKNKPRSMPLLAVGAGLLIASIIMTLGGMGLFPGIIFGGTLGLAALAAVVLLSFVAAVLAIRYAAKNPLNALMILGMLASVAGLTLLMLSSAGVLFVPVYAPILLFVVGLLALPYLLWNMFGNKKPSWSERPTSQKVLMLLAAGLPLALLLVLFTPLAGLIVPGIAGIAIVAGAAIFAPLLLYGLGTAILKHPRFAAAATGGLLLAATVLLFFLASPSLVLLSLMFTLGAALLMAGLITSLLSGKTKWNDLTTAKKVGVLLAVGVIPAVGFMIFGSALGAAILPGVGGVLILGGIVLLAPAALFLLVRGVMAAVTRIIEWVKNNPHLAIGLFGLALVIPGLILLFLLPALAPLAIFLLLVGGVLAIASVINKIRTFIRDNAVYIAVGLMIVTMGALLVLMSLGLVSLGVVVAMAFVVPLVGIGIALLRLLSEKRLTTREKVILAICLALMFGVLVAMLALVFAPALGLMTLMLIGAVAAALPLVIFGVVKAYQALKKAFNFIREHAVAIFTTMAVLGAGIMVALVATGALIVAPFVLPLVLLGSFLMMGLGWLIRKKEDPPKPMTTGQKVGLAIGFALLVSLATFAAGGALLLAGVLFPLVAITALVFAFREKLGKYPVASGILLSALAFAAITVMSMLFFPLALLPMLAVGLTAALTVFAAWMFAHKGPEIKAFAKKYPAAIGVVAGVVLLGFMLLLMPLLLPVLGAVAFGLIAAVAFILPSLFGAIIKFAREPVATSTQTADATATAEASADDTATMAADESQADQASAMSSNSPVEAEAEPEEAEQQTAEEKEDAAVTEVQAAEPLSEDDELGVEEEEEQEEQDEEAAPSAEVKKVQPGKLPEEQPTVVTPQPKPVPAPAPKKADANQPTASQNGPDYAKKLHAMQAAPGHPKPEHSDPEDHSANEESKPDSPGKVKHPTDSGDAIKGQLGRRRKTEQEEAEEAYRQGQSGFSDGPIPPAGMAGG